MMRAVSGPVSDDALSAAEAIGSPETQVGARQPGGDDQSPLSREGTATDRDKALQQATLKLDEEFAERWVSTMRNIVARELDHDTFIATKMSALKRWNQDRKREQHNLGYRFDPTRRKPRLLERDVRLQLRQTQALIEAQLAGMEISDKGEPLVAIRPTDEARGFREPPVDRARLAIEAREERRRVERKKLLDAEAALKAGRSLDGLDPVMAAMIAMDMGVANLSGATDEDILRHYAAAGVSGPDAYQYLRALKRSTNAK
jgi:hypothetical protein